MGPNLLLPSQRSTKSSTYFFLEKAKWWGGEQAAAGPAYFWDEKTTQHEEQSSHFLCNWAELVVNEVICSCAGHTEMNLMLICSSDGVIKVMLVQRGRIQSSTFCN